MTPRQNGAWSAGPTSEAGKARAARNGVRHGLTSRTLFLLPDEDPAELERHEARWLAVWNPRDLHEQEAATAAIRAMWRRAALPAAPLPGPEPIGRSAPDGFPQGPPPEGGGGEQAFAKLKALLRKAAARTKDGLWNAIGSLLDLFPPAECANYLANAGYRRSA